MFRTQSLFVTLVAVLAGNCLGREYLMRHVQSGLCLANSGAVPNLYQCGTNAVGQRWFFHGRKLINREHLGLALHIDLSKFDPEDPGDHTIAPVILGASTGGPEFDWWYDGTFLHSYWREETYALQVLPYKSTKNCNILLGSKGESKDKIGVKSDLYKNGLDEEKMKWEFVVV